MGPGDGETDAEKSVKRITVEDLLSMRMDYLAPPSSWEEEGCATKPPPACFWDSPTRIDDIKLSFEAPRIEADVSQKEKAKRGKGSKSNPNDTAPALEDCKPLEVNNKTRKERAAKWSSSGASLRGMYKGQMRRGARSGDVRVPDKAHTKPQVDKDGIVSVSTNKGFNRRASMGVMHMHKSQSNEGFQECSTRGSVVLKSEGGSGRRTCQGKFAVLNESDSRRNSKKGSSNNLVEKAEPPETVDEKEPVEEKKPELNYPSANECGDKAKNVLKEYIVGGDADDAILSIHELVGVGNEGSIDRGTKVVERAVLMVLEMKQSDVDKFLGLYLRCAKEGKIEGTSFVMGLNDPLEFLNDVAIDAPLAIPILANIIAELVKADVIPFNFLLDSPDYFRTDQNAADFGAKIMKNIGGDAIASEDYIEVIEKLMTDNDKAKHSSAQDLIAGV